MKVFVLGSTGMLGNYISSYMKQQVEVDTDQTYDVISFSREHIDASDVEGYRFLRSLFKRNGLKEGDFVINCMGTIKPRVDELGTLNALLVNSIFPHILQQVCKDLKAHMVHITTDCVFSGDKGKYNETNEHDVTDVYGRTKSLGEPVGDCTIIRTSIIGEEKGQSRSLVEWIKSRKDKDANGFTNHDWNGVTCLQLAKVIEQIVTGPVPYMGTKHIFSPEPVNKYELLNIVNDVYDLNIDIKSVEADEVIDRTLSSIWENNPSDEYSIPTIKEQIKEMKEFKWEE